MFETDVFSGHQEYKLPDSDLLPNVRGAHKHLPDTGFNSQDGSDLRLEVGGSAGDVSWELMAMASAAGGLLTEADLHELKDMFGSAETKGCLPVTDAIGQTAVSQTPAVAT